MPVTELILICAGVAYISTEAIKRSLKLKGKKNIQRVISAAIGVATAWFICDGDGEPTKKQLLIGFMGGAAATFLVLMLKGHLGSKNKFLNQLVESVDEENKEKEKIKDENDNGIDDDVEKQLIEDALKAIKEEEEKKNKENESEMPTICAICGESVCKCKGEK